MKKNVKRLFVLVGCVAALNIGATVSTATASAHHGGGHGCYSRNYDYSYSCPSGHSACARAGYCLSRLHSNSRYCHH